MNGNELLRIVDAIHRDKNIDKEIVFEGIEQAILSAAKKHFGEEEELEILIDRVSGNPTLKHVGQTVDSDHLGEILGRISAQTAKQVMIQKMREAERDSVFDDYAQMRGQIVSGTVGRAEGGATVVTLGKIEGILPRSEQIPGETHRTGDRVRAIVLEVRKAGSRVKIVLSRNHVDLVRRLFELEIPEINERVIEIRSIAREAGYRSKVAVSCFDQKVDCVGACVGVRGARIKNIVDELAGERIDIVRWNDSLQVLVPNALQPAEVEDVILCPMLGRVIVLVREDQLSLAIGKKGQNVRLASRLVGWDIEIMTRDELNEQLDRSIAAFSEIPGAPDQLAENLVEQGFLTFEDLSVIEPDQLAELSGLSLEDCDPIVEYAEVQAEQLEVEESKRRESEKLGRGLGTATRNSRVGAGLPAVVPSAPVADETETPEVEVASAEGEVDAAEVSAVEVEADANGSASSEEAGSDEAGSDETNNEETSSEEASIKEPVGDMAVAEAESGADSKNGQADHGRSDRQAEEEAE